MKKVALIIFLGSALILTFPNSLLPKYKLLNGQKDFYYGHISYSEAKFDGQDPLVIREGEETGEVAVLNYPIVPGDTIRTPEGRRCEIQFDNGTIVRLDFLTEVKIEAILAPSVTSKTKVSNLLLNRGQIYLMYKEYDSSEMFQVITSNAAVKAKHNSVMMIQLTEGGITEVQVIEGKAYVLYGPDSEWLKEEKVTSNNRLDVFKDHTIQRLTYSRGSDFENWNETINANFEESHKGKSILPQPVMRFSPGIIYFAQKYGNIYGEWVWDDLYGYVWRPHYNDVYPWGNWSPYVYGRWIDVNGELFWVPEEPWGWVPYHLGIWVWDKKKGWLWIPGSTFASAWASWGYFSGYYSWRPWTLWDWYFGPYLYSYWDMYFYFGNWYGYYGYYPNFNYYHTRGYPGFPSSQKEVITTIRKDQLKKKETLTYPIPKDLKKVYETAVNALKKGDERIIGSLSELPRHLVAVSREDLTAKRIHERMVKFDQIFTKTQEPSVKKESPASIFVPDPYQEALKIFRENIKPGEIKPDVASSIPARADEKRLGPRVISPSKTDVMPSLQPQMRVRDWNPDVQVARELRVNVIYSSKENRISIPQLGLSSDGARNPWLRFTMHQGFSPYGGGYSGSTVSPGQGTRAGPSSNVGHAAGRENSGGSKGESGGGGRVKN